MARTWWRKIFGKAPSVRVRRGRGRRLRGLEWLEPRRVLSADLAAAFDWPDPPLATAVQAANAAAFVITDASGQQAAVDPFQAAPLAELQQSYSADEDAVWQDYDLSNTFSLHSNPAADHTIYLDFDGHQTSGTSWNTSFGGGAGLVTPAWSSDSDRQSFSSAERAMIQRIWAGVSEDFAPFDVDVTTEPPPAGDLQRSGASDDRWGVRVVIGPNTWFQPAGGVAYIGSFNWNSDTPCFVFNVGEAAIREAASHEVGHTLGLHHDGDTTTEYYRGHGTGSTRWAPIMGSSYAASQSHWSRGDYAGANNHEDDLEIIATQNGFGYRQDDHGDSPNESSSLATSGNPVLESTYGRIEKGDDRDVFSFWSDAGPISLQVDPLPFAANLDVGAVCTMRTARRSPAVPRRTRHPSCSRRR